MKLAIFGNGKYRKTVKLVSLLEPNEFRRIGIYLPFIFILVLGLFFGVKILDKKAFFQAGAEGVLHRQGDHDVRACLCRGAESDSDQFPRVRSRRSQRSGQQKIRRRHHSSRGVRTDIQQPA